MPLVYQGRLQRGHPRGPAAALRLGQRALGAGTAARVDVRLAWDGPEPFTRCAAHLPADFAGYWIDVAAQLDRLDRVIEHVGTLRGGRVALACLTRGREAEVAIDLPGPAPLRLDAEQLDPLRAHLHVERLRVGYTEMVERGADDDRRRLAAGRTRAAWDRLAAMVEGSLGAYATAFIDDPREAPADPRWLDATWLGEAAVVTDPAGEPPPLPADAVALRPLVIDGTPAGLQVTLPLDADRHRFALWRRWLDLIGDPQQVLVRCMGPLDTLRAVLDDFELTHRHPHRPAQSFGLCTVRHPTPLPVEAIEAIVSAPARTEPLIEWDLRWSSLALDDAPGGGAASFYVMRDERERVYDHLQLCVALEDPGSAAFRAARRGLAARFDKSIEQPSAWQYTGPALDSPLGRRYATLAAGIAADAAAVLDGAAPLAGETPTAPGLAGRWIERLAGGDDVDLVALFDAALAAALPGFGHDRRAHLTDRYFAEFSRATPGGHHLVHLRRLHGPPGFRLSVGASLWPLPLADLDPGIGRAAPGYATPLAALVPERATLDWHYTGAPSAARAITDAVQVLRARAAPFFAAAEARLVAWRDEEET
ncbi:MAG: hypothetical protein H6705_20425 [Myxococcales bacterium]|nr:hypothetical protein [Myxococcales bacterium]